MEVVVEAPAVAPDVAAKLAERAREQINLRVVTQRGEEIFFKVKGSTKFGKLIEAFCEKKGLCAPRSNGLFLTATASMQTRHQHSWRWRTGT